MSILESLDRSVVRKLGTKPVRHEAPPKATASAASTAFGVDQFKRIASSLPNADAAATASPDTWEAVTQGYATATPADRDKLSALLRAAGLKVGTLDAGRYVTLDAPNVHVVAEPGQDRFERVAGKDRVLFAHGVPTETLQARGNGALLQSDGRRQLWSTKSADGEPTFPTAKKAPGESPRAVPATLPVNHVQLPDYGGIVAKLKANGQPVASSGIDPQAYRQFAQQLDQSVVRSGGRVIEPTSRIMNYSDPNVYNCHSFATTGGKGDLADPYDSPQRPRWINSPLYQLKEQGYSKLSPTQRVKPGDRVVYRLNGEITHTGIVRAVDAGGNPTRVESKWGNWGLFEHGAYDVPNIYGQPTDFYRPPT
ncbi:MAG TPA: hypothetical protein V6D47_04825 [Oscillatoriaceae cyanobacterium]